MSLGIEPSEVRIRALGLANASPVVLAWIGLRSNQHARGSLLPPLDRFLEGTRSRHLFQCGCRGLRQRVPVPEVVTVVGLPGDESSSRAPEPLPIRLVLDRHGTEHDSEGRLARLCECLAMYPGRGEKRFNFRYSCQDE